LNLGPQVTEISGLPAVMGPFPTNVAIKCAENDSFHADTPLANRIYSIPNSFYSFHKVYISPNIWSSVSDYKDQDDGDNGDKSLHITQTGMKYISEDTKLLT